MNPLDMAKGVYDAIEKYNDVPLMKQVAELQQAVLDQQREIARLTQELNAAKDRLETRNKVDRRGNSFFLLEDPDHPLCPSCWQGEGKAVLLSPPIWKTGGTGKECPVCRKFFQHAFGGV
jgi:hypothetical protein